jgi:hypothetical protein
MELACQLENVLSMALPDIVSRPSSSRFSPVLVSLAIAVCGNGLAQQANEVAHSTDQAPHRLKTTSNLVLVRVVVRDARGKPVEGLERQDFKLFDGEKQQVITLGVEKIDGDCLFTSSKLLGRAKESKAKRLQVNLANPSLTMVWRQEKKALFRETFHKIVPCDCTGRRIWYQSRGRFPKILRSPGLI